jgi:hypothetical protein
MHNSLTFWWWLVEFLPHRYYDPIAQKPKWRIPLGARRIIPPGSTIDPTVSERMREDPNYRPPNLPPQEPD